MHRFQGLAVATALLLASATSASATTSANVRANSVEASLKLGGYFFLNDDALEDTFAYRLSVGYNFTRMLGAELAADLSPKEANDLSIYHLHLDLIVHPFSHDWVVPFVGVGPTFATEVAAAGNDSDPGLNALVGVKLYPWEHVGFRADVRYIARFGTDDGEKTHHDMIVAAGLFISFGGEAEEEVEVLLDTDGDGFLDDVDACPTVPGVESAKGCPDRDLDTVTDPDDACPDDPGKPELAGCPDTDGDGIIDNDDRCVETPGVPEYQGCADRDADQIADPDDRCPNIPGVKLYQGCPPPPPVELVQKFTGTIEGITFEFDSDVIRPESFPVLDEAYEALALYPQLLLLVEGHTSAEGERDHNMDLSQRRADSVKRYLTDKGIDPERVQTQGFGPDRPVASNDTEEDRAANRRIEFKLLRQ